MSIEFLGVLAGVSMAFGATLVFVSHKQWKAVQSAYGLEMRRQRTGNALIWPSR